MGETKKRKKNSKGGKLNTKKKLSSLVQKWSSVKEELASDEEYEEELAVKQQREATEWAAAQIKSGEAEGNANFVEVSGDWQKRREELMRKKDLEKRGEPGTAA